MDASALPDETTACFDGGHNDGLVHFSFSTVRRAWTESGRAASTVAFISLLLLVAAACGPVPSKPDGDGFSGDAGDCDNHDPAVYPGALEVCDDQDRDEDCDGLANDEDEDVAPESFHSFNIDVDLDGFGDSAQTARVCAAPEGFVATGRDCDDSSPADYPSALAICDQQDNDCDGALESGEQDEDEDGFALCDSVRGDDCDDKNSSVNP